MHDCYLCERKESAPYSGGRCAECAARWAPKPRITTNPLGNLNEVGSTARVVKYKAPLPPLGSGPPYIAAWAAGGCMVCGAPERGGQIYTHITCSLSTSLERLDAWVQACKAFKGGVSS